jgi:hypothetical protein
MKTLLTALWLGVLSLLVPAAHAASGDITVRITDMYDQAIAGTNGARASLVGVDERGVLSLGPKYADPRGVVVFSAQELSASTLGRFSFLVYTSVPNSGLQGKLYDPFGDQWTYIQYRADGSYDFTVPTPTVGSAQPRVSWNKMNMKISMNIDWGNRRNRDFWFTRIILQKSATHLAHAGSDYGLIPVISDAWISGNGLAVSDSGLANGQTGKIRLTGQSYDESFLAQKSAVGPSIQYKVCLVNCLWGRDLVGIYDPNAKTYSVEFDPTTVFGDTNAPAWDGVAMKKDVSYFALLQGETWLLNSAGAKGGLACACGPSVAQSLLFPLHADVEAFRVGSAAVTGADFTFDFFGLPGAYVVEYSTDLKTWRFLSSGSLTSSSGIFVDRTAPQGSRFYRIRRAAQPTGVRVSSWMGGACTLLVSGAPGPTTIEYTVSLSDPRWTTLVSTNVALMPFEYTDLDASEKTRFYRVHQP